MERLWAPWRIEYILADKEEGCIFCDKPKEKNDRENLILWRGDQCFIIMNFYPYNNGHLMVVPYSHVDNLMDLNEAENLELMTSVAKCTSILQQLFKPEGFNIGMNLGRVAGAGIENHLHFHLVPRWSGDTNYMPILGHTKVVSEGLWETFDKLYPLFQKE
jgi:ATP adenylyltransferase